MKDFTIAPETEGKGRSFTGTLAASIEADQFWPGGMADTDNTRPVFAVIMTSEAESRPLIANLRMGKKAVFHEGGGYRKKNKLEFLKSAKFTPIVQRTPYGVATTLYLHDLFTHDPGMVNPEGISFILTMPKADVDAQVWDREGARDYLLQLIGKEYPPVMARCLPLAPYFAAYLDMRTHCPLPADTRFYAHLLLHCLDRGLAFVAQQDSYSWRDKAWGESAAGVVSGVDELGLTEPLFFKASHADFQAILADAAVRFLDHDGRAK